MNRRDRLRQKKRQARAERLRQQRHANRSSPTEPLDETDLPADKADLPADEPDEPNEPAVGEPGAPAPDAGAPSMIHDEERTLRRVRRAICNLVDATPAELEQAAVSLATKTLDELDQEHGDDPVERAQDLAFAAWDTDDLDELADLLEEALRLDPACIDARTLLAVQQRREKHRLAALDEVIADAAAALVDVQRDGSIWGDVAARPYLRARHERLKLLAEAGRVEEAIAEGNELLDLNPVDHLLARNHLCGALLEAGELEAARTLIDRFAGTADLTLEWARVLERFLSGDRRGAAGAQHGVAAILPEVGELILGTARLCRRGDSRATVIELLAADAYVPIARAWSRHREARRWLAEGALASTAAERRAVAESYHAPVAMLLRLGQPHFGQPGADLSRWPAYVENHGLHAEHVPELLRMADDPALHEQDSKSAAVWAPVHAWRALGLLAARGAPGAKAVTSLLLARLRDDPDDWVREDAVAVLSLVGASAFDEAAEMLLDDALDDSVRATVSCALAEIGDRHAPLREPVIGKLAQALRELVEEIEQARREEPDVAPEDLVRDEDTHVAGMLVMALVQLHAGAGASGDARVGLVERAWDLGLVLARDVGTRERVLAKLRGEATTPDDAEDVAEAE